MSEKLKVLVICRHDSGRSQIAEAYLHRLGGEGISVESAGLEPAATVNPLVVEVMREEVSTLTIKNLKRSSIFSKRADFLTIL